jgi:carboxypeptidase family protein/TonB-dependent receptor-like protein
MARVLLLALFLVPFIVPAAAAAQNQTGRLILTVNDTTGGSLPTATVTVTGLDAANREVKITPQQTTTDGVATFDLPPGRYAVVAEFTGFETSAPREVRVRTGNNRLTIVLALARLKDEVIVGRDQQVAGSDRAATFGSLLTRDQIDQLSDDPAIARQQLEDLAGPGAAILIDSFEGGQLPNKSQIRSIRISRDQFAAESHSAGGIRIEIVTQPGQGNIRGQARTNFYTSKMDGSNPLVDRAPPAQNVNSGMNLSGGLLKDRMSFSLNWSGTSNYTSPVQIASGSSDTRTRVLPIKNRTTSESYSGGIDWAVTKNQTARFSVSHYNSVSRNAGLGAYDAPERGYTSENPEWYIQAGHTGPIGRRMMLYNRFYYDEYSSKASSTVEAPTYIVPDDVSRGGAQRRGRTDTMAFYYSSDLDYVHGRHSFRSGIELQHTRFDSDSETNYLGTYYFESPGAFDAGQPRSYTRRIGDPNIRYSNTQFSIYFQDDVRLSKALTMTPGVRYELQTHTTDLNNVMPRFGVTWAPGAGRTTYRASVGIFHDWLSTSVYQQTLQFDGYRMQEVNMADPSFPDPGPLGPATPVQRYLLADDIVLPRTARASLGLSRTINPMVSVSAVYAYTRGIGLFVGENLNAPVEGVRPDPRFANVIQAVSGGRSQVHSLDSSVTLNLAGLGTNPTTGRFWQWRRGLRLSGQYTLGRQQNNTDGAFSVPATDLALEWGPSAQDVRHRANVNFGTAAVRGLTASMGLSGTTGRPLTIRTGFDNNGDLIFNDRPAGVGRNSVHVPGQWTSSANFGYAFSFGRRQVASGGGISITQAAGGALSVNVAGSEPVARYRLNLSANIQNLFNRPTYSGYSSVITSPTFLQPTSASGVRRTTININLTF